MKTLNTVGAGQKVIVDQICEQIQSHFYERFIRHGILPGEVITIIKNAKWGPLIAEVRGVPLAIDRKEAQKIRVL